PNGPSQERVIRQALANAGLGAGQVDVVEAHGTGTTLGDPIEAQALLATYGQDRPSDSPLWLGSVKSNLGHTQSAAGVAGVIKMVKALEHGVLPPTLHVDEPSRHVDWSFGAVSILSERRRWESRKGKPRRAGVSSFGISGTNAHVILEEAPSACAEPGAESSGSGVWSAGDRVVGGPAAPLLSVDCVAPWVLSGGGESGLCGQAERLVGFLLGVGDPALRVCDVGAALANRAALGHRAVIVGEDLSGLSRGVEGLVSGDSKGPAPGVVVGVANAVRNPGVVFVFSGQGSQWVGMGASLLDESPLFAELLAECDGVLGEFVDWSVIGVLRGVEGAPGLGRVDVVQPVLFCVMVALAGLWRACGVEPAAVVGHSQGEIAAACVAGGLSLRDAARVVASRGRVLRDLSGLGGMLSVAVGVDRVEGLLEGVALDGGCARGVGVAAVNGAGSVVLAGTPAALREFEARCQAEGVRTRSIEVDYAAHSAQIDTVRDRLVAGCASIEPCSSSIPFYSGVTGGLVDTAGLDGDYWFRNLRETVRFDEATRSLLGDGYRVFVEMTPHPVLGVAIDETAERELGEDAAAGVATYSSLRRDQGGLSRFLTSLARAWVNGVDVDWLAVYRGTDAKRVSLPRYAFQRRRFWLADNRRAGTGNLQTAGLTALDHRLLRAALPSAGSDEHVYLGRLSPVEDSWLADHAVLGTPLLPGVALVEAALYVSGELGCAGVRELIIATPLALSRDRPVLLQIRVSAPDEQGDRRVSFYSQAEGEDLRGAGGQAWTLHAEGALAGQTRRDPREATEYAEQWPPPDAVAVDVQEIYDRLAGMGLEYGPAFQGLTGAWVRGDEVLCEASLPDGQHATVAEFGLHPALLDAAFHAAAATRREVDAAVRLPFSWADIVLHQVGVAALRARLSVNDPAEDGVGSISLTAFDANGSLVIDVGSVSSQEVAPEHLRAMGNAGHDHLFELGWSPIDDYDGAAVGQVAMLGTFTDERLADALSTAGIGIRTHESFPALLAEDSLPSLVLLGTRSLLNSPNGDEPVAGAGTVQVSQTAVCEVLDVLQAWFAEERLLDAKLVVLTSGALAVRDSDGVEGLMDGGVWGLVRSAQAENPDRVVLVDLDPSPGEDRGARLRSMLGAALAAREPQMAIRDGRLLAPTVSRVMGDAGAAVGSHEENDVSGQGASGGSSANAGASQIDGTVLITGGTGTLGALVARHLVSEHRVSSIVLASRSGLDAPGAVQLKRELEAAGASVDIVACDVAERSAVTDLLARISDDRPLQGIVHAAGAIDDGMIDSLTVRQIERVFAPKAAAAWHLHQLTAHLDLRMFVLFSSLAGVIGNAGQGNYAAANAFLESLAAFRRARGLSATSIAWGYWEAVSDLTAELDAVDIARFRRHGIVPLSAKQGLSLLDRAWASGKAATAAMGLDAATLRAQARNGTLPKIMSGLAPLSARRAETSVSLAERLSGLDAEERKRIVLELVGDEVATVLGHQASAVIDAQRAFTDLGLDSLTAVELRNRLSAATGLKLAATLVFDYPNTAAVAGHLLKRVGENGDALQTLEREIGKLERLLSAHLADAPDRARIATRLEALVTVASGGNGAALGEDNGDLDGATDDELFELIDRELGALPHRDGHTDGPGGA
ncbi:MAG: type I polyketide synthase, partial [Solirubrobacteraceae bacterium]